MGFGYERCMATSKQTRAAKTRQELYEETERRSLSTGPSE